MWKIKQSCKIKSYIFQPKNQCRWHSFFSDHEEEDTKLIALGKGYKCSNNKKLLVRSGDIDIIVLFMLHCSGSNIFLDNEHGDA